MAEAVSVKLKPVTVTVRSSGQKIIIPSRQVHVITAGRVGPSGPAGASAEAVYQWTTQVFELAGAQQEFMLAFTPREGSVFVYLNGLLESFWSITDTTVTLEESALEGDTVTISYQKEI